MIDLLERFKESEIQNKDDLLYSLWSMYDNFDSDASAPELRKELLEKFIRHIEAMKLPRCDDWWFYSYDFTRFGMVLDMCHCAEFAVESDDEFTMTIDEVLYKSFPFLKGVNSLQIKQNVADKSNFDISLGDSIHMTITSAECERLELALLAINDIEVDESEVYI